MEASTFFLYHYDSPLSFVSDLEFESCINNSLVYTHYYLPFYLEQFIFNNNKNNKMQLTSKNLENLLHGYKFHFHWREDRSVGSSSHSFRCLNTTYRREEEEKIHPPRFETRE